MRDANIPAILQARMSSVRLPGKVLMRVKEKPLLQYTLDRLQQAEFVSKIIVATSTEKSDDPIVEYCVQHNIMCERGPLENVAKRFAQIVRKYEYDAFVRISADSPVIDPRLVDLGIKTYLNGEYDLVTNILERSFPKGQSFEVIKAQTYLRIQDQMVPGEEYEHLTRYFYNHPEEFKIYNILSSHDPADKMQLSIDTPEDIAVFEKMVDADPELLSRGWSEILQIYIATKYHECTN